LESSSRRDVVASQPIEVGKTRRADVLLVLGEPDGRAADDSWFTYGSVRTQEIGGALILIADVIGEEHVSSRVNRLTVRFDATGVLSKVDFEQGQCSGFMAARGCLNVKGHELTAADTARAHGQGVALLSYADAGFRHGKPDKCEITFRTPMSNGPLVVTDHAVVMGETALDYSQIEEVLPVRRQELDSWAVLKGHDGICIFILLPGGSIDAMRVHDAVLQQWQAVSGRSSQSE
jgi:hypothetical protein